jgi:hypothetical protein
MSLDTRMLFLPSGNNTSTTLEVSVTVGVMDAGVSWSTCYWAPSSDHLWPKEGSMTQATEKSLTRRRLMRRMMMDIAKDQKTSSRALLVRREGTPTSAQHIFMQSKRIMGRRPHTAHATPDREETNFRCACIKRHSGCWPPPKYSMDGAGRQERTSASSTHSCGPAPLPYED